MHSRILGKRVTDLEGRLRALEESKSPLRLSPNNSEVLVSGAFSTHPPEPVHHDSAKTLEQHEQRREEFSDVDLSESGKA